MTCSLHHSQFSDVFGEFEEIASQLSDSDVIRDFFDAKTGVGLFGKFQEAFFELNDWVAPPVLKEM